MSDVIRFDEVTVEYGSKQVLSDVSFSVPDGACCLSVIGPNGAGKSTLFKVALGLVKPSSGSVKILGKAPARMDRRRSPIGYVPQSREINLGFPVNVHDVVMMGRVGRLGPCRRPGRDDRDAVDGALDQVDLLALAGRQIGELSGGERQRVFIARAIAQEAKLLFLDEPAAGLDVPSRQSIYSYIDELHAVGISTITATHDLASVEMHDFKTVLCLNGRVIAFGKREEVLVERVLAQAFSSAYIHGGGEGHHLHY